jgi:hypothetical protein
MLPKVRQLPNFDPFLSKNSVFQSWLSQVARFQAFSINTSMQLI